MRNIYLIARRDYLGYVSSWGFWLGMLLTPLIISASIFVPRMIAENQPLRYYTVIEDGSALTDSILLEFEDGRVADVEAQLRSLGQSGTPGFDPDSFERFRAGVAAGLDADAALEQSNPGAIVEVPTQDFIYVPAPARTEAELLPYLRGEKLLDGEAAGSELFAAILVDQGEPGIVYLSEDVVTGSLRNVVNRASANLVERTLLEQANLDIDAFRDAVGNAPRATERRITTGGEAAGVTLQDRAPYVAAMAVTFVLWFLVFSVVNYLLTGTIEERSNKIFDSLLTSVKLSQMLAGKLIAVLLLSLTLMVTWALGAFLVSQFFGSGMPTEIAQFIGAMGTTILSPEFVIPTVLSFVLGYLIFGSLFLALGSLCENIQEAQTLISPLLIILMVPLFLLVLAIENPTSTFLATLSWIPLFTPFLLILRIPTGLPFAEVAGQIVLMAVTAGAILWAAMKVYRAGAVHGAGVDSVGRWMKGLFGGSKTAD